MNTSQKGSRLRILLGIPAMCLIALSASSHESLAQRPTFVDPPAEVTNNKGTVFEYVGLTLRAGGQRSARIYYRGECTPERLGTAVIFGKIEFPYVKIHRPAASDAGITGLQRMFRDDRDVAVTVGSFGTISIRIKAPSTAILDTKVPVLHLSPLQQSNPILVVGAIQRTNEMNEAMRKLGIQPIQSVVDYTLQEPSEEFPHLPPYLHDKSFDQILDQVASTFGDVVVYGACSHGEAFDVEFL